MKFEIKPHIGANEITFGMSRNEVHKELGKPSFSKDKSLIEFGEFKIHEPAKDGYYENELQISYDENEHVEFIEFSGKSAEHTQVFWNGIEIFKTPANQLLKLISANSKANYDKKDNEIPYSYIYKELDLALWRQVAPEVDETLMDVPESDDGKYFWTVGIGSIGYYQNA